MAQNSTEQSCIPNRRQIFIVQLFEPYWCHVWAILGPYLSYFYSIFACRCLKWLKFSPKSYACHIKKLFNVDPLGPYWGHVWAIKGPHLGYFYNILASRCLKWLKFSLKCHLYQIEEYFEVTLFGPYWSDLGHIRALFWLYLQFIYFWMPQMVEIFVEESCIPIRK